MLVFIVNPNSGNESGFKKWKRLERFLIHSKIDYKAFLTDEKGDAIRLSSKISKQYMESKEPLKIVAVGGDGTINEVLEGLNICENIVLGYIPTGTGNDLARGLRLPRTYIGCLKRVLKPKLIKCIDYGNISYGEGLHRRFIVSCGMGFDADIVKSKEEHSEKTSLCKLNPFLYLMLGISRLLSFSTSKAQIIVDDLKKLEFNNLVFISSHIHSSEGGGFKFAPKADDQDGELSVCIVHQKIIFKLIRILLSARGGNHLKYPGVRNYECTNIKIRTNTPYAIHVDGEYLGMHDEVEVSCIKGKIRFIT